MGGAPVGRKPAARRPGRVPGNGFTLVELVVVLLVLGIALAVVSPTFPRGDSEAEAAAHRLAKLLQQARRSAAERGGSVTVELDLATGVYRVLLDGAARPDSSALASGDLELPRRSHLPAPEGHTSFRFDPLGRAEGEPVLLGGPGEEIIVVVDHWTGGVRVEKR